MLNPSPSPSRSPSPPTPTTTPTTATTTTTSQTITNHLNLNTYHHRAPSTSSESSSQQSSTQQLPNRPLSLNLSTPSHPNQNQSHHSDLDNHPPHAAYVLLAEFDIDTGSGLKHQFPSPTGTAEHVLADLMLPDGAHDRNEDWTVFFLNQTPRLSVANPALPTPAPYHNLSPTTTQSAQKSGSPLLYVISLVRTKKDNSVRRGAICKAMAVCSYHPYIQIFKPILLLALEDYFVNPSIDCLARLFHAINTMDTSGLPHLSYHEKLILRCAERQDMFEEKFLGPSSAPDNRELIEGSNSTMASSYSQQNLNSASSNLSIVHNLPSSSSKILAAEPETPNMASSSSFISFDSKSVYSNNPHQRTSSGSYSNSSSNESPVQHAPPSFKSISHKRTTSNLASHLQTKSSNPNLSTNSFSCFNVTPSHSHQNLASHKRPRDTHFFDTKIDYAGKSIPVRIPLQTFPEEVGDYSLIKLIQTFSSPNALNPNGPFHPHLHSCGIFTHPIILLFNALVTQKRIVFLGHGLPARHVSEMVLAACALGSGCGGVLEGFISRAFPYSNLTIYDDFKAIPGYIAGVTNPIFELHTDAWDVFCNIETGKITVSKDIANPLQAVRPFSPAPPERSATELTTATGAVLGPPLLGSVVIDDNVKNLSLHAAHLKLETAKDSLDNVLMEDILQAIHAHFGEPIIRARFMDYVRRFVRIASRWEEDQYGTSMIGVKTAPFKLISAIKSRTTSTHGQPLYDGMSMIEKINFLGAGAVFVDEESAVKKEINLNSSRIEGWRDSDSYQNLRKKFETGGKTHFSYDVGHQISRLRMSRKMSEVEVEIIYEVLVNTIDTDEQVIEVLSGLPSYLGGLLPLTFGLFHPAKKVRKLSVELVRKFEAHPIGQKFFQALNHFNKLAYQRLAHYQLVLSDSSASSHSHHSTPAEPFLPPFTPRLTPFSPLSATHSTFSNTPAPLPPIHDRNSSVISEHESFLEF